MFVHLFLILMLSYLLTFLGFYNTNNINDTIQKHTNQINKIESLLKKQHTKLESLTTKINNYEIFIINNFSPEKVLELKYPVMINGFENLTKKQLLQLVPKMDQVGDIGDSKLGLVYSFLASLKRKTINSKEKHDLIFTNKFKLPVFIHDYLNNNYDNYVEEWYKLMKDKFF